MPAPAPGTQWAGLISAPVREHSRKPDAFYELIEVYFPNLAKIELFARHARPRWDRWGADAPEPVAAEFAMPPRRAQPPPQTNAAAPETAPAVIAHHYTEGGMVEPAARSWLSAAKLALSRSAPVEANRYVDAGLSLTSHLPDGAERHSLELALQLIRVNALWSLKGYNESEVVATLTAAQRLLNAGGGTDGQRISVLSGL